MDLAPSFLEMAQVSYPATYNHQQVYPMPGESFLPFIRGKAAIIHSKDYVYGLEHYGVVC
jgi:arylsulfatase A-like enzyme